MCYLQDARLRSRGLSGNPVAGRSSPPSPFIGVLRLTESNQHSVVQVHFHALTPRQTEISKVLSNSNQESSLQLHQAVPDREADRRPQVQSLVFFLSSAPEHVQQPQPPHLNIPRSSPLKLPFPIHCPVLPPPPIPAGTPWEHTGHTGQ